MAGPRNLGKEIDGVGWFETNSGLLHRKPPSADAAPAEPPVAAAYRETFPQLQLSLTYACNMDCSYCSFRSRMEADGRPLNMRADTALDAVDFFVETIKGETRHARIDFGLTGETFLRHKLHKRLHDEIHARTNDIGLRSVSVGPNTTNGTLSDEIGIESSMGPPQDISCDGPKEVHDAVRPYVDGRGTYDELEPLIRRVLGEHPDIGVTAVVTNRFTDITKVFVHLHDKLNFRSIYIKPVNLKPDDPDGLNAETLEAFKKGYSDFVDFLIAQDDEKKLSYLSSLNEEDYFFRFFYRIVNRTRNTYRCGAGKSGAYVDTDGNLFPCAHFIGKTGYEIGNIRDGYDEAKRDQYRSLTVESREPCRSCWAKYVCGGGCYYQAALVHDDITKPDEAKCDLIRHLVECAIRLYGHLADEHQNILAALNVSTHLPSESAKLSGDDVFSPASRIEAAPSPAARELLRTPHLIGAAPETGVSLMIEMSADAGELSIFLRGSGPVALDAVDVWLIDLNADPILMSDVPAFSDAVFGRKVLWRPDDGLMIAAPDMTGAYRKVPYPKPVLRALEGVVDRSGADALTLRFSPSNALDQVADRIGVNVKCGLANGVCAQLIRAEPFALLDLSADGPLAISTPAWTPPQERSAINASPFDGMLALSEWRGLQQNVC